jgi:hypothetical protein
VKAVVRTTSDGRMRHLPYGPASVRSAHSRARRLSIGSPAASGESLAPASTGGSSLVPARRRRGIDFSPDGEDRDHRRRERGVHP